MDLNYTAFFLISFIPLLIGYAWYHPKAPLRKKMGADHIGFTHLSVTQIIICFVLSFILVYGYINLIIHQMGFYELFFTDIMMGNQESQAVVDEFLSKYGRKHRHFGHGVFHGAINAFVFAMPFVGIKVMLEKQSWKHFLYHFLYWLITSMIIGGLISEFV